MKTKKEMKYTMYDKQATIPAGTKCIPATNLPYGTKNRLKYWAEPWKGMTEEEESWQRNYGFLLYQHEVRA